MTKNRPTRRQHFIPRLFLKGFAERVSQEFFAYEFRRGLSPQRKNIRQIGFANKFYGDTGLEEQLAIRESDYGALMDHLRKGQLEETFKPLIDELVSHLIMRTQNLRQGLQEFGNRTVTRIVEAIEETEIGSEFHKEMIKKMNADPSLQKLVDLFPPGKRQEFRRLLTQKAESSELWRETTAQLKQQLGTIDLKKGARDAQLKALSSETPYKTRIESMKPLQWIVFRYDPNTFILGDLGPFGRKEIASDWKHLVTFVGITEVCLPISHETILQGNTGGTPSRVDPISVNKASAELSREFFIAHRNSATEREYHDRLGTRSELVSSEEMESWVEEHFQKRKL